MSLAFDVLATVGQFLACAAVLAVCVVAAVTLASRGQR